MTKSGKSNFFLCDSNKYQGITEFFNLFETATTTSTTAKNIEDYFAYALKIYIEDKNPLIFIGPFVSLSKISNTKFVGNLKKKELERVDSKDMFGLGSNMAMVLYNNELVINHIPLFERCCHMQTEFNKNGLEVLTNIEKYGVIDGIEELKKVVESDSRIARRLTKMNQDPARVKAFFSNIKDVNDVLNDQKFKKQFEGIVLINDKLKYDDSKRQQFITLIADAAYQSIVGKQKRIDNSI